MATNDYGTGVSRYLDPEETGFDTVVYQKGNAVLDSELILDQDIRRFGLAQIIRNTTPSGFLTGDFDRDSNQDWDFRSEADTLYLINKPIVNVNGWIIPVEYTNTTTAGENQLVLDAPPSSAGTIAADFIFLEVWRVVIAPDPSTDNKPSATEIYRHGNVLSPAGVWLTDDLIDTDPAINTETTRRVQIQYRMKSIRLSSTSDKIGYTDANVFAQGPNGALTTFTYSQVDGDPGLWRAGDGDPTNTLNTTDGYVYSIPLALVYRRNDQGFDFLGNGNGGVLFAAGTSDRPDGYFADEIVFDDLQDMRHKTSITGMEWEREVERNTALLLDLNLRTWATNTATTGFYVGGSELAGTRILKADDLVPSTAVPSDPASGNTFGSSDGIRTVFSDRPTAQRHVVQYSPPGANWVAGDTLTLDLTANSSLGAPLADEQPNGTVIIDVLEVILNDTDGSNGYVSYPFEQITGLGTQTTTITLDAPPVGGSAEDVWVTYEVLYPAGSGLNAHVDAAASNFTTNVHDPTAFDSDIGVVFTNDDAGRTAIRSYLQLAYEDGPHREVEFTFTTDAAVTVTVYAQDSTTVILPEFLYEDAGGSTNGVVTVEDAGGGATYTVDASRTQDRQVGIDGGGPLPTNDHQVDVTYFPQRAIPTNGTPITLYYLMPGIQTIQFEYLENATPDNDLVVQPIAISPLMRVGTTGSGSPLTSFPYEAPMGQIPVHVNAAYDSEAELSAPGAISIDDFDATTGFAELPILVPMVPVDRFTFQDPISVTTENAEFLDHYTTVDLTEYRPSAFAQQLSSLAEHKVFVPMVVRLEQDTDFGRQGEYFLMVIANYTEASPDNRVGFSDTSNTTCAAIYRLKGNPLSF